ncbi:MAG TPA: glycosyltransferase family 2 protein [Humidesulfovibrio sp.]|uniref:glycosyltransferase family 2 protein n=1 Tax=Humidesulfovibrio sp. TaxID=2910988 RepID=UPI002C364890|nr:glycosyltransferase family 2 protein [Humidesulfovibrio sp.]HWR03563.1 glycosyltransferase family 2 protein [Humidesulfovibrio sp.]
MAPNIVGLILTYNGERLLGRCLESLAFCDTLIVVDSLSTDATVAIAEAAGAVVLQRKWEGPGPQFRFALEHIRAMQPTVDWVVSLDQDEYFTDELNASVRAAIANAGEEAGFLTPRASFYYDRFLRHSGWYPDYLFRVFRPDKMEVHVSGAHYSFHALGPTRKLKGDIIHYPYRNFREHLDKVNSYAQQGADDLKRKGKSGGVAKGTLRGLARFFKLYVLKLGVLDGRAGFVNAVHGAFYAFLKHLRAGETADWGPKP